MTSFTANLSPSLIAKAITLLLLVPIVKFFYVTYQIRKSFKDAARQHGQASMPHSWLFGHLKIMARLMEKYPTNHYGQAIGMMLLEEFPELEKSGCIYIDAWPFAYPMLAVFDPEMMGQFTTVKSLPKYDVHFKREFGPLTNGEDLVTIEGADHRHWRGVFNPVFSNANLIAAMPDILDDVDVFRARLASAAKSGEVLKVFRAVMNLTTDIAGRVVLGTALNSQTKPNAFRNAFHKQMTLLQLDNSPPMLMMAWNPLRPFRIMLNNRVMRRFIKPLAEASLRHAFTGHKTITAVATASFFRGEDAKPPASLPPALVTKIKQHVAIFMAGGTDSVALTISKAYDYLHHNPRVMKELIAELDSVLGPAAEVMDRVRENPALINALPYTNAVIKESLRLSPAFGTVRKGLPDFHLTHPTTGVHFPTEGMMIYGNSYHSHRHPKHWPRAGEFLPERWLAREGEELHVPKNLFRPFELGVRNCIGQEMAVLVARSTIALTVREWVVEPAYGEGAREILGEKAYQMRLEGHLGPAPSEELPAKIRVRG